MGAGGIAVRTKTLLQNYDSTFDSLKNRARLFSNASNDSRGRPTPERPDVPFHTPRAAPPNAHDRNAAGKEPSADGTDVSGWVEENADAGEDAERGAEGRNRGECGRGRRYG